MLFNLIQKLKIIKLKFLTWKAAGPTLFDKLLYRGCFLFAFIRPTKNIKRAGVGVALVNVHNSQINI